MEYRIIENTNDKHHQEVKDILKASDEVFVVSPFITDEAVSALEDAVAGVKSMIVVPN